MRDDLKHAWWKWHKQNPEFWELFEKYTYAVIDAGYEHYSVQSIVERIRWHDQIETKGDIFKINNNHCKYMAHYFHYLHTEHDGFFRTRRSA
jgi:hypothetical protein